MNNNSQKNTARVIKELIETKQQSHRRTYPGNNTTDPASGFSNSSSAVAGRPKP